ncbi:MAG TPA: hypothetical protein VFY00_03710, partial [Arenimonas sp.]|nr:hypothetical protein [Arenimonas sp.]
MTTGRLMALAAVVVVLAALAMGLWASGSPTTQREFRLDERRVADLQAIEMAIERHYRVHQTLPQQLDTLADSPGSRLSTRDPASGEHYTYEVLDGSRYRLCAVFAHDTAAAGAETQRTAAAWW